MRVSARAADVPGPTAFLEEGEQIKAGALMKARKQDWPGIRHARMSDAVIPAKAGTRGREP